MITCPNCSKENQDHYKFCLGCGSKLPQAGAAQPQVPTAQPQAPAAAPAAPAVAPPAVGAAPAAPAVPPAPGMGAAAAPGGAPCPNCGTVNPVGFAFCGRCGGKLGTVQPGAAPAPSAVPPGGTAPSPAADMGSARTMFVDGGTPPPGGGPGVAAPGGHITKLVMLGPDGEPVGERLLQGETLDIGRSLGPPWDDDAYLDPTHASLEPSAGGITIRDNGSLNGVYMKLKERLELASGDQFRVGQELLLYEDLPEPAPAADGSERMGSPNPGYWGRVTVIVEPGYASAGYVIEGSTLTIGRENGDVTFPQDGYVSGTHARITGDDTGVYLEDVGSSNGTYMRVRDGQEIAYDNLILVGQKLFRIERP